jgi:nucleotide-binding universal stress UspA family protein
MSFKRILVAINGGAIASHAARTGLELSRTLGAEIAIVYAVEPPVDYSGEIGLPADLLLEASSSETVEALRVLRQEVDLPPNASEFIREGHAHEVIIKVAEDWRADLVVVGSHGRGGLERVLLGSVAEGVVRHAPCPVLVTRKVG